MLCHRRVLVSERNLSAYLLSRKDLRKLRELTQRGSDELDDNAFAQRWVWNECWRRFLAILLFMLGDFN